MGPSRAAGKAPSGIHRASHRLCRKGIDHDANSGTRSSPAHWRGAARTVTGSDRGAGSGDRGAGDRGTDAVTLLVAIPLLVLCLLGSRRESLRWNLMLSGAVTWFLYVYLTMSVGSAFNPLFLLYVALFSAALWMLGLVVRNIDLGRLAGQLDGLPRVGPAVLMLVSAAATAVIWLVPIVAAALTSI